MKKAISVLKRHKLLTAVAAVLAVVLFISVFAPKNESSGYTEEIAAVRDIVTYNSFVGNVGFTEEMSVLSMASGKITEVLVEIGDAVSKGDVIAKLDSQTLEHNIKQTELNLETQRKANEHTLADAKRAYDNLKYSIDNGLNSTLNNVKIQKDSAEKNKNTLMDSFNDYIDKGFAPSVADAREDYQKALSEYEMFKIYYEKTVEELGGDETDKLEMYGKLLSDKADNVEIKFNEYKNTAKSHADNHDQSFKSIVDGLDAAITAYENAVVAYDSVELQLLQQLEAYEAAINKANDTLTLESAEKDLEKLKETLEDYTIVAPCDGVVTSLTLDEGNMTGTGAVVGTVSDIDKLEISIRVDEYSVLNTQVGKEVDIYIDSIDRSYKGEITYVANNATVEGGVSYFKATVEFNADEFVRGGMSVEVRLVKSKSLGAVSISVDAVDFRDDNTAFVMISGEDGHLAERNVKLGVSDGVYIEITEGLENGEKVYYIPSNFIFMIPGM